MHVLQAHLQILEKHSEQPLLTGMDCLLHISFVPDEEIFKICLDYWHHFVPVIYSGVKVSSAYTNGVFHWHGANVLENSQKRLYSAVLSKLRLLMITRMAKPEEVSSPHYWLEAISHNACIIAHPCRVQTSGESI